MCSSAETFASWATHVTRCSNPAFSRVVNRLWSNPKMQKDVLAVLTGVTKLIQSRSGNESAAEYYAALLSLLNTNTSTKAAEAYLLRLVVSKAVPVSLLRKTCAEVSKTLTSVLSAALQEENIDVSLCKSLLLSLGRVLAAQSEECWSLESMRHTYRIFLRFVDNENASLRKSCHRTVCEILTSTLSREEAFHPVCHQTISYLCSSIQTQKNYLNTLIKTSDESFGKLLRYVNLLKHILPLVSAKDVKTGCENILELTTISNTTVLKSAYDCLKAVYTGCSKDISLPFEMAGKLLTAIFSCHPRNSATLDAIALQREAESVICWLQCLHSGVSYLTLRALNPEFLGTSPTSVWPNHVASEHLEHLMKVALDFVLNTPAKNLRDVASTVLSELISDQLNAQLQNCGLLERRPRLLADLCLALQGALTLSCREAWPHVLHLTARLFYVWSINLPQFGDPSSRSYRSSVELPAEAIGLLNRVGCLRDALVDGAGAVELGTSSEETGILIDELDRFVLLSMESWGLEVVLRDGFPIACLVHELECGSVELRRSWLLPLLARARPSQRCSLAFFFTDLLPLVDRCLVVAKAAAANTFTRKVGHSKTFVPLSAILNAGVILSRQIWNILTAFTRKAPTRWADLIDSGLGGRLINGLLTAKAVRPTILSALRRLISFADTEESRLVMRAGAKQMVPKILALYEEQDEHDKDRQLKQQLGATLAVFLPLLTPKMLSIPCEMALKKLVSTERPVYMEILQLISPNLSIEHTEKLLQQLEVYLVKENCKCPLLRKSAYLVLEAIISSPNSVSKDFFSKNLGDLIILVDRIASADASMVDPNNLCSHMASLRVSKLGRKSVLPWKPRLRILRFLLQGLVSQEVQTAQEVGIETDLTKVTQFINRFLPEVLPNLISLNSLVRVLTSRLLVDMVGAVAGLTFDGLTSGSQRKHGFRCSATSLVAPSVSARMEDEDDKDAEDDERGSFSGTSMAPTEAVSVTSAITISGMEAAVAIKVCSGLRMILSYLWPAILKSTPEEVKDSPTYVSQLTILAKAITHVFSDRFLRRALMAASQLDDETGGEVAIEILSMINQVAQCLVRLPNHELSRMGLQLSRLLIAFVGKSVYVSDVVTALQSVHESQKRPLRFFTKSIVEKLLKKASVHALQSLMDTSYHKMIRNSAKLQVRRERKRNGAIGGTNKELTCGSEGSDEQTESMSTRRERTPSMSGSSLVSYGAASHFSGARRVHIVDYNEIVAGSDDDVKSIAADNATFEKPVPSIPAELPKRQGLAAELESAASMAGLSRRSRKKLRKGCFNSSDDDDDSMVDRPRVRFADSVAEISATSRKRPAQTTPTWLIEDVDDEVLDLADPEALARHTKIAASADIARWTHLTQRKVIGAGILPFTSAKRSRITSLASAFPERDGRIVIDDSTTGKQTEHDDWLLADDDNEKSADYEKRLKAAVAAASAVASKQHLSIAGCDDRRLPGSLYRSTRAKGDMKKPGLPDPYAYVPLGAGLSVGSSASGKGRKGTRFANNTERRLLLRSLGAGKQKRSKKNPRFAQKDKKNTTKVGKLSQILRQRSKSKKSSER